MVGGGLWWAFSSSRMERWSWFDFTGSFVVGAKSRMSTIAACTSICRD